MKVAEKEETVPGKHSTWLGSWSPNQLKDAGARITSLWWFKIWIVGRWNPSKSQQQCLSGEEALFEGPRTS